MKTFRMSQCFDFALKKVLNFLVHLSNVLYLRNIFNKSLNIFL
jgi:hypothetical protein